MADGDPVFWSPGEIKLKLLHVQSGQALGVSSSCSCRCLLYLLLQSSGKRLPEWGFQQYEVSSTQ